MNQDLSRYHQPITDLFKIADAQRYRLTEALWFHDAARHHVDPATQDAMIVVDIDLSILGAATARFEEYEVQVREEYSWVPEIVYRRGRRKILQDFAHRERIYRTEYFRTEYEDRARENIARSLTRDL